MKTFDLEKLQSFTLSGEKISKEIFDALFNSDTPPYHYHSQNSSSGFYSYNYNAFNHQPSSPDTSIVESSFYHQQATTKLDEGSSLNVRNYELFKGAFETAVICGKSEVNTETIGSEYPFYENRFYQQTQHQQQNYNY